MNEPARHGSQSSQLLNAQPRALNCPGMTRPCGYAPARTTARPIVRARGTMAGRKGLRLSMTPRTNRTARRPARSSSPADQRPGRPSRPSGTYGHRPGDCSFVFPRIKSEEMRGGSTARSRRRPFAAGRPHLALIRAHRRHGIRSVRRTHRARRSGPDGLTAQSRPRRRRGTDTHRRVSARRSSPAS
jgi:hypothetical protein